MPQISINEKEELSFAAFDVTENAVLVPIVWATSVVGSDGSYAFNENDTVIPAVKLYTAVADFEKDFSTGGGVASGDRLGSSKRCVVVSSQDDPTYEMIRYLLKVGFKVVMKPIAISEIGEEFDLAAHIQNDRISLTRSEYIEFLSTMITEKHALEEFKDRNLYNIKFITSGAYENVLEPVASQADDTAETVNKSYFTELVSIAEARGDAVALVELPNFGDISDSEVCEKISGCFTSSLGSSMTYAAAFYPWFNAQVNGRILVMPACLGYLAAYANSVKTNANWFAASGAVRGEIPCMTSAGPVKNVGEGLMHVLQGDEAYSSATSAGYLNITINPIYNAGSYGIRIWGNRTAKARNKVLDLAYSDFLNVRILVSDIKKQVYHAAMRTTFEPNDDIVWFSFKNLASELLDKMKSGRGISQYKWVRETVSEKALIKAHLYITPIEAVESFDVTVVLSNDKADVEETTAGAVVNDKAEV